MNFDFSHYINCLTASISYVPTTLLMAVEALVIGFIVGGAIAIVRVFKVKVFSQIFGVLVAVMKAVPTNLIMIISNLLITGYFDIVMKKLNFNISIKVVDMLYVAVFALVIASISSLSESFRGALMSVDDSQYEAGYSVGLTKRQTFLRIVFPQAFLVMMPSLTGNVIALVKMTSLASIIGVMDVLNGSIKFASTSYSFLEAYMAAATIYWIISIVLEYIGNIIESNFGKHRKLV